MKPEGLELVAWLPVQQPPGSSSPYFSVYLPHAQTACSRAPVPLWGREGPAEGQQALLSKCCARLLAAGGCYRGNKPLSPPCPVQDTNTNTRIFESD